MAKVSAFQQALSMIGNLLQPKQQELISPVPKSMLGNSPANPGPTVMLNDINGGTYDIPFNMYQKRMAIVRADQQKKAAQQAQQPKASPTPIPVPSATPLATPLATPMPTPLPTPQATPKPAGVTGRSQKYWVAVSPGNERTRNTIIKVAQEVGVSPELMLDIAAQESMFNPNGQANKGGFDGKTQVLDPATGKMVTLPYSTAAGLYQFTNGTWEEAMRRYPQMLTSMDQRMDPYYNAWAAANFIKNGMLSRWNASRGVWGPSYTDAELAPYYPKKKS